MGKHSASKQEKAQKYNDIWRNGESAASSFVYDPTIVSHNSHTTTTSSRLGSMVRRVSRRDKAERAETNTSRVWTGNVAKVLGVVAAGAILGSMGGNAASAEAAPKQSHGNVYVLGGHFQGDGKEFTKIVERSQYGEEAAVHRTPWSGEIGELFASDQRLTKESVQEGAGKIEKAIGTRQPHAGADKQASASKKKIIGHSQATMAIGEYVKQHPEFLEDGGKVVLVGSPYVSGRELGRNNLFRIVSPAVPGIDKVLAQTPRGEGVTTITNEDDPTLLKSAESSPNPVGLLSDIVGMGAGKGSHGYNAKDLSGETPHVTTTNPDGSKSIILTETDVKLPGSQGNAKSGISAGLVEAGVPVSKATDEFFEAADGEPTTGEWDMKKVTTTGAAALDEAIPGAGKVVGGIVNEAGTQKRLQGAADAYLASQDEVLGSIADAVTSSPQIEEVAPKLLEGAMSVAEAANNVSKGNYTLPPIQLPGSKK